MAELETFEDLFGSDDEEPAVANNNDAVEIPDLQPTQSFQIDDSIPPEAEPVEEVPMPKPLDGFQVPMPMPTGEPQGPPPLAAVVPPRRAPSPAFDAGPPPMEAIPDMEEIPNLQQAEMNPKSSTMQDLFGSDIDDPPEESNTMQDLFGSDVDDDIPAANDRFVSVPPPKKRPPAVQRKEFRRICPHGEAQTVQIANIPRPQGSAGECVVIRVPNVVALESENFDPNTYKPHKSNSVLEKTSYIRWRIVVENNDQLKESNSRLVTWSDGSKSLVIGKEVFDIQETKFEPDQHFLYAQCESTAPEGEEIFTSHGQIRAKYHVKTVNTGDMVSEISHSVIARRHMRPTKSKKMSVAVREQLEREKRKGTDALGNIRKRKRQTKRLDKKKKQKMTEEFLEVGATDINPEDMDDGESTDDDQSTRLMSSSKVGQKLSNLVGGERQSELPDEGSSESEEEPLTKLRTPNNPNSKIVIDDDSDSD